MGKKLAAYVHVTDSKTGQSKVLKPGTDEGDLSKGVKEQLTNPKVWEGEESEAQQPATQYDHYDAKALKAEIESRNEGREDDDKIKVRANARDVSLRQALAEDDAAQIQAASH